MASAGVNQINRSYQEVDIMGEKIEGLRLDIMWAALLSELNKCARSTGSTGRDVYRLEVIDNEKMIVRRDKEYAEAACMIRRIQIRTNYYSPQYGIKIKTSRWDCNTNRLRKDIDRYKEIAPVLHSKCNIIMPKLVSDEIKKKKVKDQQDADRAKVKKEFAWADERFNDNSIKTNMIQLIGTGKSYPEYRYRIGNSGSNSYYIFDIEYEFSAKQIQDVIEFIEDVKSKDY